MNSEKLEASRKAREEAAKMKQELTEWLRIMRLADTVLRKYYGPLRRLRSIFHPNTALGTGDVYYRTFKPRIEKVIAEATNSLSAASAPQNGHQQGAETQRTSGLQSTMNHELPYGQTNGYSSATYNPAPTNAIPVSESGQHLTGSVSSERHPPLYPEAYQYAHAGHNPVADVPYHAGANLPQGQPYGSVSYQQDTQQLPQTSATPHNSSTFVPYAQPPVQHHDPFSSLQYDDLVISAPWPTTIFMMPQPQHHQQ